MGKYVIRHHLHGRADYHIHSTFSDGVSTPEQIVDYVDLETDLDVIAITDHDAINGSLKAQRYALEKRKRVEVITGEEISTRSGHIVGLFITKKIKRYTGLISTIKDIHGQGGLVIVPHPLSWLTTSVGKKSFKNVIEHKDKDVYFDAVELINPSIAGRIKDKKAKQINDELWKLPVTGGSDSHDLDGIGTAYTIFPGKTAEAFRQAILDDKTTFGGKYWDFKTHWFLFWKKAAKGKFFSQYY